MVAAPRSRDRSRDVIGALFGSVGTRSTKPLLVRGSTNASGGSRVPQHGVVGDDELLTIARSRRPAGDE
jgi:hypothetical protein